MANILDEQERKRKELAAQGIRTRGVAGAQGGPAEMTYKPLEQRTGAEAKALGVSPQMQAQIAQEQGLIPPAALPAPAVTPSQAPAQQSRGASPQAQGVTPQAQGTNQQLTNMRRESMGTTNTSLTQLAARLDPSVRADTERRRQWRMMTPQQRRAEVDALALQQDARIADSATPGGWNDVTAYSRDIADPSGTFVDSYGRNTQIYSPEAQMKMRQHQRNIDKEVGEMLSNFDRTSWSDPQSMREAFASLKSVQDAGDFGKAYVFNLMRRYSSPQMRAQMEAEDRNKRLFEDWGITEGAKAIAEFQAQNPGIPVTANGTRDIMGSIYLHREDDPASAAVWQMFLDSTPTLFTAIDGNVKVDPAQEGRFEQAQAQRKAKSDANAKEEELRALEEYEDKRYAAIQQMNPERAARMIKNPITRKYDDLETYAPKPPDGLPPRATTDTAYDAAQKTVQTATRQLELQQTDPIEFKKKAISGAVSFGAEDFEKQGIANIINGISADNDMSAQEIINAIAASGFGNVFNAEAFQKAMTEYEEAKNMSPQVLEARRRRAAEEAAQIERDAYGIEATPIVSPQSAAGPVQISSDAEYDALPVGTEYIGPDGITRVK